MNKRGQFYLIAAFIIIAVVISFVSIANYSTRQSFTRIYTLKEELQIEAEKVLDYETLTGNGVLEDFTSNFSSYAGEDVDIYYVTENEAYAYDNGIKDDSIVYDNNGDEINVEIDGAEFQFDLMPGKNFYFIISQEIRGERYLVTG